MTMRNVSQLRLVLFFVFTSVFLSSSALADWDDLGGSSSVGVSSNYNYQSYDNYNTNYNTRSYSGLDYMSNNAGLDLTKNMMTPTGVGMTMNTGGGNTLGVTQLTGFNTGYTSGNDYAYFNTNLNSPIKTVYTNDVLTKGTYNNVDLTSTNGKYVSIPITGENAWKVGDKTGIVPYKTQFDPVSGGFDDRAVVWVGKTSNDFAYSANLNDKSFTATDFKAGTNLPVWHTTPLANTILNPDEIGKAGGSYTPVKGAPAPVASVFGANNMGKGFFSMSALNIGGKSPTFQINLSRAGVTIRPGSIIGIGKGYEDGMVLIPGQTFTPSTDSGQSFVQLHPQVESGRSLVVQPFNAKVSNGSSVCADGGCSVEETADNVRYVMIDKTGSQGVRTSTMNLNSMFKIDFGEKGMPNAKNLIDGISKQGDSFGVSKTAGTKEAIVGFEVDSTGFLKNVVSDKAAVKLGMGLDNISRYKGTVFVSNDKISFNKSDTSGNFAQREENKIFKVGKEGFTSFGDAAQYLTKLSREKAGSMIDKKVSQAIVFYEKGDKDKAEKILKGLIADNYSVPEIYLMLGNISFEKNRNEDAVNYYALANLSADKSGDKSFGVTPDNDKYRKQHFLDSVVARQNEIESGWQQGYSKSIIGDNSPKPQKGYDAVSLFQGILNDPSFIKSDEADVAAKPEKMGEAVAALQIKNTYARLFPEDSKPEIEAHRAEIMTSVQIGDMKIGRIISEGSSSDLEQLANNPYLGTRPYIYYNTLGNVYEREGNYNRAYNAYTQAVDDCMTRSSVDRIVGSVSDESLKNELQYYVDSNNIYNKVEDY